MQFVSRFGCVSNSYFTLEYEYSGKHISYDKFTALGDSSIGYKNTHTQVHIRFDLIFYMFFQ